MSNQNKIATQNDIPKMCEQIADGLDECCLMIDAVGQKSKNATFEFPYVIDRTNDAKDAELYDIDTERLFALLAVEIKEVLTKLRHYSPANAQTLQGKFDQIEKQATELNMSSPRPSTTRLPRMADYSSLVTGHINYLTFNLPKQADELRRVAKLLAEDKKQKIDPQEKDGQSKTNIPDYKALNLAKVPISRLIKQGESHTLEFKETLDYDIQNKGKNKDILLSSLKTIAGFLNAAGGTLLIGVDDSGKIKGIKRDLSIMKNGNNDKFELKIRNCLKELFQPQPFGKVNISFKKFPEGTNCRVDVQASEDIIHLDKRVYVREGNSTQLLVERTLTDWIQQRILLTALPSGK